MKFLKAIGLIVVAVTLLAAIAQADEVATRTGVLTGAVANAGGTVTWTNNTDWASIEILYIQAWDMLTGNGCTLTASRVSTYYTETLGTIAGAAATSNGILILKTDDIGKDLVDGDKIKLDASATNLSFKANITYKVLKP